MEKLNCEDMAAETGNKKKKIFRKPNSILWTATLFVITYAVWCVLLLILTASGNLLNNQGFECVNSKEEASRLKNKARLVYLWAGLSLLVCILLLLEFWRRKGFYAKVFGAATCILFVIMILSFIKSWKEETQEIKEFEKHYLALLPLRDTPGNTESQTDTICHKRNVYRWQAEFKCCGLQGYQDWESSIPDSCLCDGEDNSSGCVEVGNSLVYEKPCLPTVLSLVEKHTSTFWAIMIVWMTIIGAPVAVFILCLVVGFLVCCSWMIHEAYGYKLTYCIYRMRGGEEMVPVVFIRHNNNNQTEEENGKDREAKESGRDDGVVLDVEGGTNAEGEGREAAEEDWNDNPVRMIPLSELRRLQEELDPPPVQHQVQSCMSLLFSIKSKNFYTILLEEGSLLLPSGAVLVDANKPTKHCFWEEGPHVFVVDSIVWPREKKPEGTQPLL